MDEIWGEANVSFPDWKGTAQLDERHTLPWKGLARMVGLDTEEWQVVGFNIGGGELGYGLRVYATPREAWVRADGESDVEVTEFLVHDVDPLKILQEMTHVFELNMRIRGLDQRKVRITALSDLPPQED